MVNLTGEEIIPVLYQNLLDSSPKLLVSVMHIYWYGTKTETKHQNLGATAETTHD